MHEASLVQGLMALVDHSVSSWNAAHPEERTSRITGLNLRLGLASCIEEQTLQGCFELMAEGTVAEGATLHIERAPLSCTCRDCRTSFSLTERRFVCPACQGRNLDFVGGHELTLLNLEAAREGAEAPAGRQAPDRTPAPVRQEGSQEGLPEGSQEGPQEK